MKKTRPGVAARLIEKPYAALRMSSAVGGHAKSAARKPSVAASATGTGSGAASGRFLLPTVSDMVPFG